MAQKVAEVPVSQLTSGRTVASALADAGLAPSLADARRLISQGKVRVDDRPVTDVNYLFDPAPGTVLQAGNRSARLVEG